MITALQGRFCEDKLVNTVVSSLTDPAGRGHVLFTYLSAAPSIAPGKLTCLFIEFINGCCSKVYQMWESSTNVKLPRT